MNKAGFRLAFSITPKNESERRTADVMIYGEIVESGWEWRSDDTSGKKFAQALEDMGDVDVLNIYINSPGGSAFDGIAMRNALLRKKCGEKNIYIDGLCASAATLPACLPKTEGVHVYAGTGCQFMIHNAWTYAGGTSEDLRQVADQLDKLHESLVDIYATRCPKKRDEIGAMMDAETWFGAQEMIDNGFADELTEPVLDEAVASLTREQAAELGYKRMPKALMKSEPEADADEQPFSRAHEKGAPKKVQTNAGKQPPAESISNGARASTEHTAVPKGATKTTERMNRKMDLQQLQQEHPELYAQAMEAGATAERERMQALEDICPEGENEMLALAKFGDKEHKPMTNSEFAMALLAKQKADKAAADAAAKAQGEKFNAARAKETQDMTQVEAGASGLNDESAELEKYRAMAEKAAKNLPQRRL